jgi:hypothetical protein
MNPEFSRNHMLRVTLHEQDMQSLMTQYPMLTRTEISDVITRHGPLRGAVEAELARISSRKR